MRLSLVSIMGGAIVVGALAAASMSVDASRAARGQATTLPRLVDQVPAPQPGEQMLIDDDLRLRLEAMRRPVLPSTSREDEAAAMAVGFVAALFARDCGFIARRVTYPSAMDHGIARTAADVIPEEACARDAATADPLAVLKGQGLVPIAVDAERYASWVDRAEQDAVEGLQRIEPRPDDLLVTATFDRSGMLHQARVLLSGPTGGLKVVGYAD